MAGMKSTHPFLWASQLLHEAWSRRAESTGEVESSRPKWSHDSKRRASLIFLATTGTLVGAWVSSRLPVQYEAEASFIVARTEAGLPATSLISQDLIDLTLDQFGWQSNGKAKPAFDARVQAVPPDQDQVTVVACCANPGDASQLSIGLAENLRHRQFAPVSGASDEALREAEEKVAATQARFRAALAEWGSEEWTDPALGGDVVPVQATESRDGVFTAPAMISPARSEEKTLVHDALTECESRRQRLADLYTEEHPAVIALDRQISHLASLLKQEGAGSVASAGRGLVQTTAHQKSTSETASAELEARREMMDRLVSERDQAAAELDQVRKVSATETSILPTALSEVSPGPRPLRCVGSSRPSLFVGWTALILVACALTEFLAITRSRWAHQSSSAGN